MKARSRIALVFVASLACLAVGNVLNSIWRPRTGVFFEGTLSTMYPYARVGDSFVIAGLGLLTVAMIAAVILVSRRLLSRAIEREVARQMGRGNKTT